MLLAGHFGPRGERTDEANLRERRSARPPCHWPAGSHLDPFIASLIEQQYRASVIFIKARHGLALDRWLSKHRVALADLGYLLAKHVTVATRTCPSLGCTYRKHKTAVDRLRIGR
jgi:hypothetical protein